MTEVVTYQASLGVAPERVFAVLLRAISGRGRLHQVEGYGTALTFTPTLGSPRESRRLRACVQAEDHGTALRVVPEEAPTRTLDRAGEEAWVNAVLADLHAHFESERGPCPARVTSSSRQSGPPQPRTEAPDSH